MLKRLGSISVLVTCLLAGLALVTFEPQPIVHAKKKTDPPADDQCSKKDCNKVARLRDDICEATAIDAEDLANCLATVDACRDACFNLCHFDQSEIVSCEPNAYGFSDFPEFP